MALIQGNVYKQNALSCALDETAYNYYNEQLYWKEEAFCCRYVLINNSIEEQCKNE